jgi:hypothetical protein
MRLPKASAHGFRLVLDNCAAEFEWGDTTALKEHLDSHVKFPATGKVIKESCKQEMPDEFAKQERTYMDSKLKDDSPLQKSERGSFGHESEVKQEPPLKSPAGARPIAFRHSVGGDDIPLGVVCAQRKNLLVCARLIPRTCPLAISKVDDDQMHRPSPLPYLYVAAMYDESTSKRPQRRIDAFQVLDRSHGNFAQVGDSVCQTGFEKFVLSRVSTM